MKNINYPLLLGGFIVLLLAIISFYPELFTSKDPLFEEAPKYIQYKEDGALTEEFSHNPMRPNKENIFGTDDAGRDLYARIIYGTRNTLRLVVLIAVFRTLIALPLGLAAGMGVKFVSEIIRVFSTFFTAIPMLVLSYIILNMSYFRYLEMDIAINAFAIVLTIVGWPKLAGLIEDNVKRVMGEDFIEGEIAIGKTKFQIAYQNIIPHIIPSSVSLFFKEMGMALFLIAQLAVLYVFVGIIREVKAMAFVANYDMILEPEWGGLLSRISVDVGRLETSYWLSVYPVLAISIGIIGLNLLGEGLRIEFSKRDSRIISFIKKISYQLSPKLFFEQIQGIRKNYRPVGIKALIILTLIAYFSIQWHPSTYTFDLDMAKAHIHELSDERYEQRIVGTEAGYLAGDYIIDTLKSYGYEVEVTEILSDTEEEEEILYPGRNISAFLPGMGKTKEDPGPVILIGAIYGRQDPLELEYEEFEPSPIMTTTPPATSLEIARVLSLMDEPFEKSIEFIFWDNESEYAYTQNHRSGSGYFNFIEQKTLEMTLSDGYYYIDISFPGYDYDQLLEFAVLPSQKPDTDGQSYLIGLDMEKRLKQLDVDYKRIHYTGGYASSILEVISLNSITSIGVGSPHSGVSDFEMNDIEELNLQKLNDMGQIIIDILTMNPRIME